VFCIDFSNPSPVEFTTDGFDFKGLHFVDLGADGLALTESTPPANVPELRFSNDGVRIEFPLPVRGVRVDVRSLTFAEILADPALLARHLEPARFLVPAFHSLFRGESGGPGALELTKDGLHTGFVRLARSIAAARTAIVLIDDLHFAPPEGLALFDALARGILEHRVLLIGGTRPGLPADWLAGIEVQEHASRIDLLRLGRDDIAGILAERYGSRILSEEWILRADESYRAYYQQVRHRMIPFVF
jgi:hypothetical protein